jgi:hypothetical protein
LELKEANSSNDLKFCSMKVAYLRAVQREMPTDFAASEMDEPTPFAKNAASRLSLKGGIFLAGNSLSLF